MEALCFSILTGFWAWWVCPLHAWNFPFHSSLSLTHLWHAGWGWCKHTWGPRHPYEVPVFADKVMVTEESLQKDSGARYRKQPGILLCLGLLQRSRCHCLSKDRTCSCAFVCSCSGMQQMPLFDMSLKCVPDHQLAPPYLPTAMPPQLTSNQYLPWTTMNHRHTSTPPLTASRPRVIAVKWLSPGI